jgi:hypothetical protein
VSRTVAGLALVTMAAALLSCYTQVRTGPPGTPRRSEPPPPKIAKIETPADTLWAQSIDGEYAGYSLVVDASGHHMGKLRFSLSAGSYHCEVESLPPLEGTYSFDEGDIVLAGEPKDTSHDWTLAPEGRYAFRRVTNGLSLTRNEGGVYCEIGLSRAGVER